MSGGERNNVGSRSPRSESLNPRLRARSRKPSRGSNSPRATEMEKTLLFKPLHPVLILDVHFKPGELQALRTTLEQNGCPVTNSIFHAEIVITKLTHDKRIRREIHELIRRGARGQATKDIDIINEKWVRKCLEEKKLVDWPLAESTWRIVRIPAIQPISPPKRERSPEKFAVPETPASKRARTQAGTENSSSVTGRPAFRSVPSFDSASSEDPSSKRFRVSSQASSNQSSGEDDETFDFRDVYSCRRKSPLISRNERFVNLLVEIKLARELALYSLPLKLT
jgi:hypothetical protein